MNKRLYRIWRNMKSRCYNPNVHNYKYYGGKGITICDDWHTFSNFEKWALINGYEDFLTIDRINVLDNYCPKNCRWISIKAQQNNRGNNIRLTFLGQTYTLSEWAVRIGIRPNTLERRYLNGWTTEQILTTKKRIYRKR